MTPPFRVSPARSVAAPNQATPGSPYELALRHGLAQSGARPTLPTYVRLLWARRHFILEYARARNEVRHVLPSGRLSHAAETASVGPRNATRW